MKKVALVACSNALLEKDKDTVNQLKVILHKMNIETVESPYLYAGSSTLSGNSLTPDTDAMPGKSLLPDIENISDGIFASNDSCTLEKGTLSYNNYASGDARKRAEILNHFYKDDTIDAIFDLSGGDMANELLPYIDFQTIGQSSKVFYGYSDLTTILNAIYAKTGRASMLFQLKTLVWDETGLQQERFRDYLAGGSSLQSADWTLLQGFENGTDCSLPQDSRRDPDCSLFRDSRKATDYSLLQNSKQEADYSLLQDSGNVEQLLKNHTVLGGNVRCFLKLAGTPYFPDLNHKILFLESMSGGVPQISTYMAQLHQLGVFEKADAVLLGTFTEMEQKRYSPGVYEILKQYLPERLPVAQTREIGHGIRSKALRIG